MRMELKIGDMILGTFDSEKAEVIVGAPFSKEQAGESVIFRIDKMLNTYDRLGYTTDLDTLKLIFQNMTLRGSSLTNSDLNDPIEKERVGIEKFAGSRFIICFSHEDHESVPFWIYYGKKIRNRKVLLQFQNFAKDEEILKSCIDFEYCLGPESKKCFFGSPEYWKHLTEDVKKGPDEVDYIKGISVSEFSVIDVEYVPIDSSIFTEDYSGISNVTFPSTGGNTNSIVPMKAYDLSDLGKQKSNPWEYEKETRILYSLSKNDHTSWDYLDLRLKPEFFRNLNIVLSPWEDEKLEGLVRDVVNQSVLPDDIKTSIYISSSGLKGKLHFPE